MGRKEKEGKKSLEQIETISTTVFYNCLKKSRANKSHRKYNVCNCLKDVET